MNRWNKATKVNRECVIAVLMDETTRARQFQQRARDRGLTALADDYSGVIDAFQGAVEALQGVAE